MFRRISTLLSLAAVLSLISCAWPISTRTGTGSGRFKLTLNFPSPHTDNISSRALALEGDYIYIEIAEIDDEALYSAEYPQSVTADNVAGIEVLQGTGGEWQDAPWGGRAALELNYTGQSSLTAELSGIPLDANLIVRVLQTPTRQAFESTFVEPLGEILPLTQTYTSVTGGIWKDRGLSITAEEFNEGRVTLSLRPHPGGMESAGTRVNVSPDSAIKNILGVESSPRPASGATRFMPLRVSVSGSDSVTFRDIAMAVTLRYVKSRADAPVPAALDIYDSQGQAVRPQIVRTNGDETVQIHLVNTPLVTNDGQNNEYFAGLSVFDGVTLDGSVSPAQYSAVEWDAQVLGLLPGDELMTQISNPVLGNFDTVNISWPYPSIAGNVNTFAHGDLEFKVLHYWHNLDTPPGNALFSIEEFTSLNPQGDNRYKPPVTVLDWSTAEPYKQEGNSVRYTLNAVSLLPAGTITPALGDGFVTMILARVPGGTPFILGVQPGQYPAEQAPPE